MTQSKASILKRPVRALWDLRLKFNQQKGAAKMNNAQRKAIAELVVKLNNLKDEAGTLGAQIQELADDEQEKFDNLSEGLQQSDNGQKMEESAQALGNAAQLACDGELQQAIDELEGLE